MKIRYIFPLLYVFLILVAFLLNSEGLLMISSLPTNILLSWIGSYFEQPGMLTSDLTWVFISQAVFWFLLGYALDKLIERISSKKLSDY